MANVALAWHGEEFKRVFEKAMGMRVNSACVYLETQIKADISQAGTLRYRTTTRAGKESKRQTTVYNFTHSRPGNPPFKQTGELRRSITHETVRLVGRVGTNLKKGRALELGTKHMAPRPYIRANLIKHTGPIRQILCGQMRPGELKQVTSNQSRSGHLGAGGIAAGYDNP